MAEILDQGGTRFSGWNRSAGGFRWNPVNAARGLTRAWNAGTGVAQRHRWLPRGSSYARGGRKREGLLTPTPKQELTI